MNFPQPEKISEGATRWPPSRLIAWEQSRGIEMPSPSGMLTVKQVAERYGVSIATVWRWAAKSKSCCGQTTAA